MCRTQLRDGGPGRRKEEGQGLRQTGAQDVPEDLQGPLRGHVWEPQDVCPEQSCRVSGREEEPREAGRGSAGAPALPCTVWRKNAGPTVIPLSVGPPTWVACYKVSSQLSSEQT